MSPTTSARISTTASPEAITAATEAGTEYGDKRAELAYQLYEIGSVAGIWRYASEHMRARYLADADVALRALPHLLSNGERERLAPLLPTVAL